MTKESTQSFAVSDEEKFAIDVLATAEGMKPATFARQIFYRGLFQYLNDRSVTAEALDEDIFNEVRSLIGSEEKLKRVKAGIEMKREQQKPSGVYASRNLSHESEKPAHKKRVAGKNKGR